MDFRYLEIAQDTDTGCIVMSYSGYKSSVLPVLEKLGIKKLGVEWNYLTLKGFDTLKKVFDGIEIVDSGLDDIINGIRMCKSREEAEFIVSAQRIAEKAFENILNFIKPGVTEKQIEARLMCDGTLAGSEGPSFEYIVVSGPNTSKPHGKAGERTVQPGDFITMDYGCTYNGYLSDMTRTVAVGDVTDEQRHLYETVLKAQRIALDMIAPGVSCREIDKAARDYIIGFEKYKNGFGHSLGHSVGLEIHETPVFGPKSEDVCRQGHIMTVEPGIYLPGEYGCRIEDMVYITENGYENLTLSPKELIIL